LIPLSIRGPSSGFPRVAAIPLFTETLFSRMEEIKRKKEARRGYWFRQMKKLIIELDQEVALLKFEKQTLLLNLNFYFESGKAKGRKEVEQMQKKEKENYRTKYLDSVIKINSLETQLNETLKKAIYYPNSLPKVTTPAIKTISNYDTTPFDKRHSEIYALEIYIDPFRPKVNRKKRKKRKKKSIGSIKRKRLT